MAWVEHRLGTFRVRLRLPDGTVVTDSSHLDRPTALIRATEIDVELARDRFLDPRDGQITLNDWVQLWQATHHAGPATWSAYHSHLRLHILPALGHLAPSRIRRQHVKALVNQLADRLAPRSTRDVLTVLSLVLNEAVDYRRIPHNPARGIRIPGRHPTERPHATPAQVAQIVARLPCRADQILVLTAAYTGLRWGELAGLQRTNLDLPHADLYVHPDTGALHEISGTLFLGPPKPPTPYATSRCPRFWSTCSGRCARATTATLSSAVPAATFSAAPTSPGAPGAPPSTATPSTTRRRSFRVCIFTICATVTKPGSSKTASPKSPKPAASATACPASAASTATPPQPWTRPSSTPCNTAGPPPSTRHHPRRLRSRSCGTPRNASETAPRKPDDVVLPICSPCTEHNGRWPLPNHLAKDI